MRKPSLSLLGIGDVFAAIEAEVVFLSFGPGKEQIEMLFAEEKHWAVGGQLGVHGNFAGFEECRRFWVFCELDLLESETRFCK